MELNRGGEAQRSQQEPGKKAEGFWRECYPHGLCGLFFYFNFLSHGIELQPVAAVPKENQNQDHLSVLYPFLATQITDVEIFDSQGASIPTPVATAEDKLPLIDSGRQAARVVARLDYLRMEYVPPAAGEIEKFRVEGFKYNPCSNDIRESYKALQERAKAALNLAYAANAKGWTKIDFGQTSDPVMRAMLMLACKHVGLDTGQEGIGGSCVPGVKVDPLPPLNTPFLKAFIQDNIKLKNNPPTETTPNILFDAAHTLGIETFIKHPTAPIDGQNRKKLSPLSSPPPRGEPDIRVKTTSVDSRTRRFILNNCRCSLPPYRTQQNPVTLDDPSYANMINSPVLHAIFEFLLNEEKHPRSSPPIVKLWTIPAQQGSPATEVIEITIEPPSSSSDSPEKGQQIWGKDWRTDNEYLVGRIREILERRLKGGRTLIIGDGPAYNPTKDFRKASRKEVEEDLRRVAAPENVRTHNNAESKDADAALTVPEDGWDPRTGKLSVVMGGACGSGGTCGAQFGTQKIIIGRMTMLYHRLNSIEFHLQ